MSVDFIPYVTMVLGLGAVAAQYKSFIESKDMTNIPYIGLLGMMLIGVLSYIYSANKNLPLLPIYVNLLVAVILISTKLVFKETNLLSSDEKKCKE